MINMTYITINSESCSNNASNKIKSQQFYTLLVHINNYNHHRRTGRHFTVGRAEKICPENNNLP